MIANNNQKVPRTIHDVTRVISALRFEMYDRKPVL